MKKTITVSFLTCFMMLTISATAQSDDPKNIFKDCTSFKISTDFLSQSRHSDRGHSNFLYSSPAFGAEMNYALTKNFIVNAGLTYSGSRSESIGTLYYVIQPEDDAIHSIKSEDTFRSFSLEPKTKLEFSLNRFDFFWSAGPIISVASLHGENQTSTFENPNHFTTNSQSTSRSLGFGGQASTGFQYFFSKHIGLSAEIGYKYLLHNSLQTQDEMSGQVQHFEYELNTLFQRAGIVFKF